MATLPLAWLILKISWPIWVATYHQLGPSFGHLRPNFAGIFNHMTPCTRRNAPKAPKILSAFNLLRFSIHLELHFPRSLFVQCHSVRSNSLHEQVSFSPAWARFSSPLELFSARRAVIARMYVFLWWMIHWLRSVLNLYPEGDKTMQTELQRGLKSR